MLDRTNDWEFPVEMQPVYDRYGMPIPESKCIMRTDTNEVLGVHGARYNMIPHDDVINSMMDAVKDADITNDYHLEVHVIDGGRKLRGEIIFPDLVTQPSVGDYVQFRTSFFNSYDGSWSFGQMADGLRLWCTNGCVTADAFAYYKSRHTTSLSVSGSSAKISKALHGFIQEPDKWREWMKIRVDDEMASVFFKHTLAKVSSHGDITRINEKQYEFLMQQWAKEKRALGPNKWALYNTMTYWSSHTEVSSKPQITRRNRESMVVSALRHKEWKAMA